MVIKSNWYYLYHTFSLIFGPLLYKPQHFVEDFGLHEFFLFISVRLFLLDYKTLILTISFG